MSSTLWFIPAVAQAALMTVDEFHFHRRRELPRWERWGHPMDAAFLLAALCAQRFAASPANVQSPFIILAILSCLIITKDEWVHSRECSAGEQWVHSVLFILHPLVLIAAVPLSMFATGRLFLSVQIAAITLCSLYQVLYWNVRRSAS